MTDNVKQLSAAIDRLGGIHARAHASFTRQLDSIGKAIKASRTPAARIRAGSRAGAASVKLTELQVHEKYARELKDPAFSAAFHPARKFAVLTSRRTL